MKRDFQCHLQNYTRVINIYFLSTMKLKPIDLSITIKEVFCYFVIFGVIVGNTKCWKLIYVNGIIKQYNNMPLR